jgi:hypothetical protein
LPHPKPSLLVITLEKIQIISPDMLYYHNASSDVEETRRFSELKLSSFVMQHLPMEI